MLAFVSKGECFLAECSAAGIGLSAKEHTHGLTLVAPPEPFAPDSMPVVLKVGADWMAVVLYAFTRRGTPTVRYDVAGWLWWGGQPEGACETICLAQAVGLRVMLKPQLYASGGWTGDLAFDNDQDWQQWEEQYARYILEVARIAASLDVELFCIGTEFRTAIAQRPAFWSAIIAQVRQMYCGPLTYSANWDNWEAVLFWQHLDHIGLSAYFPLVEADRLQVEQLKATWMPHVQRLPINELAQANCLEALLATFQPEPWWAGGFLWKWPTHRRGHERYPERDYTPQGKLAEQTLRQWYRRH